MHYLLHIDTSTDTGTVAIAGDGILLTSAINEESRNHAGTINNLIDDIAKSAGIALDQLSAVAVCAGPGSYTGLRIGMATAKGLCYALNKSLIADNRLTVLAYQCHVNEPNYDQYIVLLKAREKEYFITIHNKSFDCILAPQHVHEDELAHIIQKDEKTYIIGDITEELVNSLNIRDLSISSNSKIELENWCLYSYSKYNCNTTVNLSDSEPFYLKQVYTHK